MRYSDQIQSHKNIFLQKNKQHAKTYLMFVFIEMCQPNNKKPLQTKQNIDKYGL